MNLQDVEKITNKDTSIVIETNAINKSDYTTSTIKAKITLGEEIASIKIRGEEIEIPEKVEENGKYIYEIEKQVEENGNYKIKVETISGRTNYKIQKVSDLSEDMEIYTAEDLVKFRDRVNKGATYKGRTIKVMNDIDLRSVCSSENSWEPIGIVDNTTQDILTPFSGTFNGNNKTIDYLYINESSNVAQGLFSAIQNATILGVIIGENSNINGGNNSAGIIGYSVNSDILYCGNNANVTANGDGCAAGIVGALDGGKIIACYNKGNIVGNACVGGICGDSWRYTQEDDEKKIEIKYSYNTGRIKSTGNFAGGICGLAEGYTKIEKCYNKGKVISNNEACGGISGKLSPNRYVNKIPTHAESAKVQIIYSCNIGNVESSGKRIGGICGHNGQYCIVKNNYILTGIEIKIGTTTATKSIGEANQYIGRYVGATYDNSKTYIDGNEEITNAVNTETGDITNTVYYIVNGMSSNDSEYWDKLSPTEPKLKWELNLEK